MKLKFEVAGEPVAQARPRVVRTKKGVRGIDPAKSKNYKAWVKCCALNAFRKLETKETKKLLESPLKVKLFIYRSIPTSDSKKLKTQKQNNDVLPTVKPDIDNVFKAVTDALNGIIWQDDRQIVNAEIAKRYSSIPRVEIEIEEI